MSALAKWVDLQKQALREHNFEIVHLSFGYLQHLTTDQILELSDCLGLGCEVGWVSGKTKIQFESYLGDLEFELMCRAANRDPAVFHPDCSSEDKVKCSESVQTLRELEYACRSVLYEPGFMKTKDVIPYWRLRIYVRMFRRAVNSAPVRGECYKVTRLGLRKPHYLVGTVHMAPAGRTELAAGTANHGRM